MRTFKNLASAGVISKLSIRQWSGRAGDKQAGRDTAARHSAKEGMVRVTKSLVPEESLEWIRKLSSEVRAYHYNNTLVWTEGAHFLPARLSIPYSTAMQDFRLRFDRLAAEFCGQYSSLIAGVPELLGRLYRAKDYPTPAKMRTLFGIDVSYEPVPEGGHFFENLASSMLSDFRLDLEAKNEEREKQMRRDLWNRLRDPVLKMAEALSDPDRIFRDTLVTNVHDIAQRMDALNVFDDPDLSRMAATVRGNLSTLDPAVLRSSRDDRAAAADEAQVMADRIAERMSGYMSFEQAA